MNQPVYAVLFSPVDHPNDPAEYQIITEEQANALRLAWGPPELPDFFNSIYVIDSEEWLCLSPSLEEAQMDLFARWVLCLDSRFKDGTDWFGSDYSEPEKILRNDVNCWINKAKIGLFFDIKPVDNLFDFLSD